MALRVSGTGSYAQATASPPVTALPLTLACWFRVAAGGGGGKTLFGLSDTGAGDNQPGFDITIDGSNLYAVEAGDSGQSIASQTYSGTGWNHGAAVFTSTSSRVAYVNGTAGTTDTEARSYTAGDIDGFAILDGVYPGDSGDDVSVAECAAWSVALDASEIAALAKGVSPQLIRPSALVVYYPLIRHTVTASSVIPDKRGGQNLTVTGSGLSIVEHPRVIYPKRAIRSPAVSSLPTISGAASITLDTISPSLSGSLIVGGSSSITLDTLSISASGALTLVGSLDVALGAISASLAGSLLIDGASSATLDGISISSDSIASFLGSLDKGLDSISAEIAASLRIDGSLSATFETISIVATDNVVILGALDGALDGVSASLVSTLSIDGSLNATLNSLSFTLSGALDVDGSVDKTLDEISIDSSGALRIDGSLGGTLASISLSATDDNSISGSLSSQLGGISASLLGSLIIGGSLNATLSAVSITAAGSIQISGQLSSVLADATLAAYELAPTTGLLSVTLADLQAYISAVAVSDMKTLQDFLPFVLPLLPSAPEPVVIIALRNAAIRFCERSRAWRHVVEIETDGNEDETITVPDQSSLFEIEEAWFKTTDGNWRGPLKRIQFSKIDADDLPTVGDTPTGSSPQYISQQSHDKLVIYPIAAGTLRVSAFVAPSQSAVLVPDFLYDRYAQVIADGALANLLMIPEQPYTNAQLAVIKKASFDEFCDHKFTHNIRGQQRASGRVRSSYL